MAVAAAAVNVFRTQTIDVGVSTVGIYTAPVGYTGVILLSQVTNTSSETETIEFGYERENGSRTPIVKDIPVPPNDTVNLLPGKLVVETGDSLTMIGSTSIGLKYISSILETSNL